MQIAIFNNRYTKKICLYKWEDGHYDVLYEKKKYDEVCFINQFIRDVFFLLKDNKW